MAALPEHHKFPRSRSELVRKLEVWTGDTEAIYREYERLQEFTKETVSGSTEVAEEHRKENRYKDILPYNWRSVKIPREEPKPGEDHNKYINASWILFKNYKQKFIASQAPLEDTIPDFWHCVVHHRVSIVVMLTDLVEGTKVKCAQYWPSSGNALYSDTEVTMEGEEEVEHYIVRSLRVVQGEEAPREVTHIQVKGWGDYSVPSTTATLLALLAKVREVSSSLTLGKRGSVLSKPPPPILVHCSAGVGRTGTFIATHRLLENADHTAILGRPNVWDTVVDMRTARPKMVQKKEQYGYIYSCIHDHMAAHMTK